MSILIKGINPPGSCNDCPFSIILDDLVCTDKFAFCIPLKEKICGPDSDIEVARALCDKLYKCPIEPLPPNLKDVDKFKSDYYMGYGGEEDE